MSANVGKKSYVLGLFDAEMPEKTYGAPHNMVRITPRCDKCGIEKSFDANIASTNTWMGVPIVDGCHDEALSLNETHEVSVYGLI